MPFAPSPTEPEVDFVMSVRRVVSPVRLSCLALALYGVIAGGGVARAGCGNHDASVARYLDSDLLVTQIVETGRPTLPADRPPPCTGPDCSRRTETPLTVSTTDRRVPDRCIDPVRTTLPRPDRVCLAFASVPLAHNPPSLERPERPPRP